MIYSSLAVFAMSASALFSPLSNVLHLHPKMPDARVNVTLYNNARSFRDVKIDGHTYTVMQHETLSIKAPAGTVVFAASRTATLHRGDPMLAITPAMNHHQVNID